MLHPFSTLPLLLSSVLPILLRVKSESLVPVCSHPNEALLQIEIKSNRLLFFPPHHDTTRISMVLSDLSSRAHDTVVPERSSIASSSTILNDTATTTIVSKDICLPANHCHILAIYDSARSAGACCGYHDEGWYYKVAFNGIAIKEGNEFRSSDYLQFGGGCQTPSSKDKSGNDGRSLFSGASADETSTKNSYVVLDEERRRYFPRPEDISELGQSMQPLPDCTKQGRTGCIVNPSSFRGASVHLPSISYQQNPACANGACTLGIPMSKQHVDFAEHLIPNVKHIGFTEAKTKSLPNSSGYSSNGIAAGDLNGDGLVDLVVATYSYYGTPNNQTIYLNSGSKANPFKMAIDLPYTDSEASSVVKLADIDNDNDSFLDILFISDQKAFVLFNNITDPLNFSRVNLDTNTAAYDLSVGDANNDGWLDIIVVTDSGIVLFLNMKNDDFREIELPPLGRASQVEFVDIDNDGRIDIIFLSSYSDVTVFMNKNGNGTFLEEDVIVIRENYERFCVGDINGDEFPDLILAKFSGGLGSVELLVNNGTGFHDSKTLILPQANLFITSIEAGDLNGDGMIDLVFGTFESSNFMILNKGGGGFTEAIDLPGTSSFTWGIVIADVNDDSALDIVIANWFGEDKVLLNLLPIDSSSFGAALSLPGGTSYSMAVADFNQDGFIDIVVGNWGADQILLNNKGDGSFLEGAIDLPTTSLSSWAVAVGEIIGDDNLPDIVVCGDIGCEILRNNGDLQFHPISLSSWESRAIGIGDVNNDTFVDIIIGGYGSDGGDTLFINDNGTFSLDNSILLPGFKGGITSSIAVADFNGDNW